MVIFLVLIAVQFDCCILTNIESRVNVSQFGHYSLYVSRESQGIVSSIPAFLEFDNRYRILTFDEYRTDGVLRFGVRDDVCRIPFPVSTGQGNFRNSGYPLIGLGITPDSDFIRFVGSAGIVRRREDSRLVVNMTDEYWDTACVDNSSLSFPVPPITGGISFSLLIGSRPVEWSNASYTTVFGSNWNDVIQAPGIIIDAIHGQLARLGCVGVFRVRSLFFQNCTSEIILQLPDLVVSWPSIGSLLITSREYVHHYPTVNMCVLRIGRLSSDSVELSPLRFNDLNIRTTQNTIIFCDPESLD